MNPRIQELAEQAGASVLREQTRSGDWVDFSDYTGFDHTKFAELIVRECARAVDKVYEDAEPDHGCYDWATWAEGADVLKHFGVEE
jgi:hypothetical protein